MKDLGNVFFVLGIQIHLDCSLGIFSLSQKAHVDKVLDIFNMKNSVPRDTLIAKSNKFKLTSMPKKGNWTKAMQNIPYVFVVRSLMYVQVCILLGIAYIVGMLGR